uniref:Uncharacterized protein n=1 Tax=Globodera rostochiensis TaxID=31243 RepID=A0A914HAK5_GLORO
MEEQNALNSSAHHFLLHFSRTEHPQLPVGPSPGANAPPPSCGTGSEHSGSACPSPGPMKRFRQIYGASDATSSPSPSTATSRPKNAMDWTESWMVAHHGECAAQPSTSTSAPSVISTGSAVTNLSALSVDTRLTVAVDLMNLEPCQQLLFHQMAKCDGPSSSNNSSSHIENMDPCHFEKMRNYLSLIHAQLGSLDESSEFNAICQLYRVGKYHHFLYCSESASVSSIVQHLVEIILRPNTKSTGNVCLNAIRSLESAGRGFFLNTIILCLRSEVENDSRYATNILSSLFTHQTMGEFFRRQARTQHVVRDLMMALQQDSYGFRHRFLRHIYLLIRPSKELKRFFHQSNGMQMCLDLFEASIDEPMLHACATLLLLLVDDPTGRAMADHFVKLNGIQTLSRRLDHGSSRLLLDIARCLSSCSDSDQLASQSIDGAIQKAIQLLASTDGELVRHITGFLVNIQAKNPGAKAFMQTHDAIPNLLFLLSVWTTSSPPAVVTHKCPNDGSDVKNCELCRHSIAQKEGTAEIVDTVLLALCNLTNGVNADPTVSCLAVMEFRDDPIALFHRLLTSPDTSEPIRVRLLTLLARLLTHLGQNILNRAVQRIVTNHQQKGTSVKDARALAALSLHILNELIKHQFLFDVLISVIRDTDWNPFLLLCSLKDEKLEISLAEFLCRLSSSPVLLTEWTRFSDTLKFCTNIPHVANYVNAIISRIMHLMNASNTVCKRPINGYD